MARAGRSIWKLPGAAQADENGKYIWKTKRKRAPMQRLDAENCSKLPSSGMREVHDASIQSTDLGWGTDVAP